ncbi:N-acetyltaurine hydrolase-like [Amphiura filiformis]|uniref:N-acetyltaurine hydrolase-like n=1 Tax=Amphiura filiformis TaxID=82378 RepID=UPI003B2136F0
MEIPFTMENLWWIRQYPFSHKPNCDTLNEYDAVIKEMAFLKDNGGGTVVDTTVYGQKRDVRRLADVSKQTGIQVVSGTGFYVETSDAPHLIEGKLEQLTEIILNDIQNGADGTNIKCGLIGEVGCSWPLKDSEKKSLRATAMAQSQAGCPVTIHPSANTSAPKEIVRLLGEAGCDLSKVTMAHLDRTFCTKEEFLEFAESTSCYLELDLFGNELSYYPFADFDSPSDAQRIKWVKLLVDEGYSDRILISHDAGTRHRLMKYGGHGYSHIYRNVLPKMKLRGIGDDVIDMICTRNPQQFLTFK